MSSKCVKIFLTCPKIKQKDLKNFKIEFSQHRHFNPSGQLKKTLKPLQASTMPVPVNKYNTMIEQYLNIRNLINRPAIDIRGVRNLLTKVQEMEEQNMHPITRDIIERTIYYIIDINYNEEENTRNDKMDMLAKVLEDVTNVIKSGSYNIQQDIKDIWIAQGKLLEHEPDFDNLVDITRLITEATTNLLFNTTRASLYPHWISSDEEEQEDEEENPEDDYDEIIFLDKINEENNLQDEAREENNLYWTDH